MEKVGELLCEKILIVQDNLRGSATTPEILSRSGYATALIRKTPRAVEKIGQEIPDLVILDLGMATPDRLELLSQLKSNRFTSHIPVFVVGSPGQPVDPIVWMTVGADDYLDYPFHAAVLDARIRAILRRQVVYHPVTHLPASPYLQRQVDGWLARNTPTALLYLDIDHFASYNSAYGRDAGDRVLQYLAKLIVDVLPRGNLSVAHMGEDDFMVAFPPPGVETFVETLVQRFHASQNEFYNKTDLLRGYVRESDPGLPPRQWPLMTLSVAMVTNERDSFTNFLHACSLLCKQMARIKAEKGETDFVLEPPPAAAARPSTPLKELRREFYRRICEESRRENFMEFEEYAPVLGAHFSAEGDHLRAARFFSMAGDRAQRMFDLVEARAQYENVLANLAQLSEDQPHLRQQAEGVARYAMLAYGSVSPGDILTRLTAVESFAHGLADAKGQVHRGDRFTMARIHLWTARLLNFTNRPLEGIAYCQQVQAELEDIGEEEFATVPSGEVGLAFARQGQFGRAIPLLLPVVAYFKEEADWLQWMYSVAYLAVSLVARGEVAAGFAHAEAMVRRALELSSKSALTVCHLYLSLIYILGGELEKSLSSAQACVAMAAETRELSLLRMGYGFRAWAESLLGNLTAAQESLRLEGETARQLGGQLELPDLFAAIGAETALRLGSAEKALTLAQQAVDLARQIKSVFVEAFGERVIAKVTALNSPAQYDAAERHLISSVNAFESGECFVEAARTRVVWGLLAAANGKSATARKQLERAASQFESSGLAREAMEAREILFALVPQGDA